jgi:uncharacterized membrane protein AbrB (regulator of aidB expression)
VLLAAVYALLLVMAAWLAAWIIGSVVAIASAPLRRIRTKALKRIDPVPKKTVQR